MLIRGLVAFLTTSFKKLSATHGVPHGASFQFTLPPGAPSARNEVRGVAARPALMPPRPRCVIRIWTCRPSRERASSTAASQRRVCAAGNIIRAKEEGEKALDLAPGNARMI